MGKKKPIIAAILSAIICGSGQVLVSKQRIKGFLFFVVQFIFIFLELRTGYWIEYALGMIDEFSIRIYGGVFTKGIWGLVTLGEVSMEDHSIILLVTGVIVALILIAYTWFYIYNIKDAYTTALNEETLSSKQYFKNLYHKTFAQITLFPIALLFIMVVVLPIIITVLIAFTNYSKTNLPPANLVDWVGIENFMKLLNVPIWTTTFLNILGWTIIWTLCVTLISYFLGMYLAILLNGIESKLKKVYQSILILPWAIPALVMLLYFRVAFNGQFGPINSMLIDYGIIETQIPFLSDPLLAKIIVIGIAVWLTFPSFMIMILSLLSNFSTEVYEAARIDGATKVQMFRSITLPQLFIATAPLLIMNLAFNFNSFGTIYFVTEGGPVNVNYQFAGDTDILISWIYELTLEQQMYGMASVMSILIFVFIAIVSIWNFRRTVSFKEM